MIPLATTTIAVSRVAEPEPGEGRTATLLTSGVRANIGTLIGQETNAPGGGKMEVIARLDCDPCDLRHTDQVTDETTGQVWEVQWVAQKNGLGLDHLEGSIVLIEGATA